MPLVRGTHRFDSQFTQIPNAWLRDPRLSYKARGILAELLTHAPGFSVSIDRLGRSGRDGRDAIASGVSELEKHGYLKREQVRNSDGTLSHTVWTTQDPDFAAIAGVSPTTDYPSTGYPSTGNPERKNTEVKNTEASSDVKTNVRSTGVLADAFNRFWTAFPRKADKLAARKAFEKAYSQAGEAVIEGAAALAADPNLPPKQFIPYPATWLNAGGWENEPYPERQKSKEELEAEAKAAAVADREKRIAQHEAHKREMAAAAAKAAPPPDCEHGIPIWRCLPCARKLEP